MLKFYQEKPEFATQSSIDTVLETGALQMRACVFNVVGNRFYKFKPGCFSTYIKSGELPALLWGHNDSGISPGSFQYLEEDSKGLKAELKLNLDDDLGLKIAKQIVFVAKNGGKQIGASVGLSSSQREIVSKENKKDQIYEIIDTDLAEISLCNCPAIRGAGVTFSQAAKALGLNQSETNSRSELLKKFMLDNKQDFQITIRSLEAMARDVLNFSEREAKELAFALKEQDPNLFYKPRDVVKTADELFIEMFTV